MPFAFLAPMFLAGSALLVVPWYIHHIRRPEREPIRFSSLIFIPQVKKEVIERQRLQHILLMLIRMVLLALLALAFARPFLEAVIAVDKPTGAANHVILIDTSYSMGTGDWFSRAKDEARNIVDSLGPEDRVGVVAFARTPVVLASISSDNPPGETRTQARRAIETARLTEDATVFVPALRRAQDMLTSDRGPAGQPSDNLHIHLISDYQKLGMPERDAGWKLSREISLHPVEVGGPGVPNQSIIDLSVRETQNDGLRIQGKVKNWSSDEERPIDVRLVVNGSLAAVNTLVVKARNASRTSFNVEAAQDEPIEGRLEIDDESLVADNRMYFSRTPKRKKRILLVTDDQTEKRFPAASLLAHAVPERADLPWRLSRVRQNEFTGRLPRDSTAPDALFVCDLDGIAPETAETALAHVRAGGQMLLVLSEKMVSDELNAAMLSPLGLRSVGLRRGDARETLFDLMSWVDLDHTIFFPFRGSRFNDFSQIRFFNYHHLELTGAGESMPRVLARFDAAGSAGLGLPAIVEAPFGTGRVIVWTFGIDLEWSTLPKSPRFVPIVHETLAYLTGGDTVDRSWQIGDQPAHPVGTTDRAGQWLVALPQEFSAHALNPGKEPSLRQAGFLRWKQGNANGWQRVEAVNVNPREGDPTRIAPAELELKLCAAPVLARPDGTGNDTSSAAPENLVRRRECGWQIIAVFFAMLTVESVYASYLMKKPVSTDEV